MKIKNNLSAIDKNGRQNGYENSFQCLAEAGIALPCYNVTEPQPPLQINAKHNYISFYLL